MNSWSNSCRKSPGRSPREVDGLRSVRSLECLLCDCTCQICETVTLFTHCSYLLSLMLLAVIYACGHCFVLVYPYITKVESPTHRYSCKAHCIILLFPITIFH